MVTEFGAPEYTFEKLGMAVYICYPEKWTLE